MDIDLSTPEKALHLLEHAYRTKDLELSIRCRNFEHEANLMLHHLKKSGDGAHLSDPSTVAQLAEILELKWKQAAPPNFDGITSKVSSVEHYTDKFYVVTEDGRYADGRQFSQRIFMSKSNDQWAVLCPASIYEAPRKSKPWWVFWR